MQVKVKRQTAETRTIVILDDGPRDPEAKKKLKTPLEFLNHMLEHIAWRSELNIAVEVEMDHFSLNHLVGEDVGITLGRAFKELLERRLEQGGTGYGFALAAIDDSLARAVVSFEGRAYLDLNFNNIIVPMATEGVNSEDLVAFWEGFVQGAQATLHLDLLKGRDNHGHHHWESLFRAAGQALRDALNIRPWRKDMTAGVAGRINFSVEVNP
ncbi:MAG: imidazoleglycerol-phosphate dehydratase [Clostridia bacterium]|nr:imidazoleglycerol-phosphate dehydratase [Clostridia bacterium]